MMFWGGEYQRNVNMQQQRRAVQFNSHIINSRGKGSSGGEGTPEGASAESKKTAVEVKKVSNSTAMLKSDEPILDFRIIAGAPLRSK